jgi:hypothetical protein
VVDGVSPLEALLDEELACGVLQEAKVKPLIQSKTSKEIKQRFVEIILIYKPSKGTSKNLANSAP